MHGMSDDPVDNNAFQRPDFKDKQRSSIGRATTCRINTLQNVAARQLPFAPDRASHCDLTGVSWPCPALMGGRMLPFQVDPLTGLPLITLPLDNTRAAQAPFPKDSIGFSHRRCGPTTGTTSRRAQRGEITDLRFTFFRARKPMGAEASLSMAALMQEAQAASICTAAWKNLFAT